MVTTFDVGGLGEFSFRIAEGADTSTTSNNHETAVVLTSLNNQIPSGRVYGLSSINFKQLIEAGGGSFDGTVQMNRGSAGGCDPNIFANLAPLTISGTLNVQEHRVSLALKGKVYF